MAGISLKASLMKPVAIITLGLAPMIAVIIYLYFRRRSDNGFSRLLAYSFLTGAAGVLLLVAAEAIYARLDSRSTFRIARSRSDAY